MRNCVKLDVIMDCYCYYFIYYLFIRDWIDFTKTAVYLRFFPSITDLINTSLSSSIFHIEWKIAEVVPIPKTKTDDHELANNNRSISLLPTLSKVCERVVHKQVDLYLISKDRLATAQSGKEKHHSTEKSIIHSYECIIKVMDKKKLLRPSF